MCQCNFKRHFGLANLNFLWVKIDARTESRRKWVIKILVMCSSSKFKLFVAPKGSWAWKDITKIVDISDPNYWRELNKADLLKTFGIKENKNVAKNIILLIGDGMGPPTITGTIIVIKIIQLPKLPKCNFIFQLPESTKVNLKKIKVSCFLKNFPTWACLG